MKEASYYKKLKEDIVQCVLCPNYCTLKPTWYGSCKTRQNVDGRLVTHSYGLPVATHVDPIEKKPLYHFLPGEAVFSFGTAGCNLHCAWCQNYDISQRGPRSLFSESMSPEELVGAAKDGGCRMIAYTYTEPTVFYEYMLETAKLARRQDIRNVIVSNGYINPEPLSELINYIDAANIDLKSMSNAVYKEYCEARLEPVLESIKTLYKSGVWLELTNLLIPGINTSDAQVGELVEWVKENCGVEVPLHFSAFHPCYNMTDVERTPTATVLRARKLAMKAGLKYVYVGNVRGDEGANTHCPNCKEVTIRRAGFVKSLLKEGKCKCGEKIEGVWK